jgi:hypothetical protein
MLRFLTMMHTPLFKEAFGGSLHVSFFDSGLASIRHRALEGLGIEDRFLFMLFLSWWFNEQPDRLVALCAPNSD